RARADASGPHTCPRIIRVDFWRSTAATNVDLSIELLVQLVDRIDRLALIARDVLRGWLTVPDRCPAASRGKSRLALWQWGRPKARTRAGSTTCALREGHG